MNIGGGLNYVTGPMGAGKTLYGVRRIVQAVCMERYAVTNVELHPDWAERTAFHFAKFRGRSARARIAEKLSGYYLYEPTLKEAMRYRLPAGKGEARGVFVWDETHNDLNNRKWRDDGRDAILEWATQLRKLGFVGFLLSQHADNTDAALRRVCSFLVRVQNQKEQTRLLGMRVTPWPLFLAAWYPSHLAFVGSQVKPAQVERYFLSWHRHLYDTLGLYHGLALVESDAQAVIQLPPGGRRPLAKPAAAPGAGITDASAPPLPAAPISAGFASGASVSPAKPGNPVGVDSGDLGAILARSGEWGDVRPGAQGSGL